MNVHIRYKQAGYNETFLCKKIEFAAESASFHNVTDGVAYTYEFPTGQKTQTSHLVVELGTVENISVTD